MADLNALIAQGYQFQPPPDPFVQYGRMQQLQQGEQANQLAKYQFEAAKRADLQANALNQAYGNAVNPDTGEIDYAQVRKSLATGGAGSQIPALEKSRLEQATAALTQQKLAGEVAAQPEALKKLKGEIAAQDPALALKKIEVLNSQFDQSKRLLNQIDPNSPDAGNQLMAWHQSNHAPGVLGDTLRANGSTPEQTISNIQAAIAQGPKGIANFIQRSTLGQTEFAAKIAPIPKEVTDGQKKFFVDSNPQSPTFGMKVGGEGFAVQLTPGESSTATTAAKRLAFEQGKFAWEKANPGKTIKEVSQADGSTQVFAIDNRTGTATPVMIAGAPSAAPAGGGQGAIGVTGDRVGPATPLIGTKDKALTESQGNATAFGMRMKDSHAALKDLENKGVKNTGVIGSTVGGVVGLVPLIGDKLAAGVDNIYNVLPQVLGGYSPEQQQVLNGRINFITAVLRKESGASIQPSEFATMEKLYFPRPGDDAVGIKQKQNARELAIKAMKVQAGPGAKSIEELGTGGGEWRVIP